MKALLAIAMLLAAPAAAHGHAATTPDPDEELVSPRFDIEWAAVEHPVSVSGRLIRHTIKTMGPYVVARPTLLIRVPNETAPHKFRVYRFDGPYVNGPDGRMPVGVAERPADPDTIAYAFSRDQLGDHDRYEWRVTTTPYTSRGDHLPDEGWIEHRLPRDLPVAAAAAKAGPPTRLWYRVSATVEQTRGGESFELKGNDPVVRVLKQHHARVAYRLRSRHAIVLYRQCTPLAADVAPKLLALLVESRTTTTCAQARRHLRDRDMRPRELRALRLVDDIRFTAAGVGALDAFERTVDVPAHTFRFANTVGNAVCPPTQDVRRVLQLPLEIGGALRTASAARDGVSAELGLPSGLLALETGTAGGPCIHDLTGRELTASGLVQGQASTVGLWESTAYGRFPTSPAPRFRIGKRFGRAFAITRMQTLTEPVTPSWQTGPWTTTLKTTLRFDPCPRRGRKVDGC